MALVYIREPNLDQKLQKVLMDVNLYGRAYYKFDEDGKIMNIRYEDVEGQSYGKSIVEDIRERIRPD